MGRRNSPRQSKRFGYVLKSTENSSTETNYDSSDNEAVKAPARKKVRSDLTVWDLKKSSECFKTDDDHIYSKSEEIQHIDDQDSNVLQGSKHSEFADDLIKSSIKESGKKVQSVFFKSKQPSCSSKNAIMARLNRERKKRYISSLENSNSDLQRKNDEILKKVGKQEKIIAVLQHEVLYLKSILANSKEISLVLNNLKESTGLPVTSSLKSYQLGNETTAFFPVTSDKKMESKCNTDVHQANVKKVTSGSNFPILQKDLNLNSCIDFNDYEDLMNQNGSSIDVISNLETDFHCNNDLHLSDSDLNSFSFDFPIEPDLSDFYIDTEFAVGNKCHVKDLKHPDNLLENQLYKNVGVCLHINNRQISVELCSKCNSLAQIT